MHALLLSTLAAFLPAAIGIPTPLERRDISYNTTCDASDGPNWDDCDRAMAMFDEDAGLDGGYLWQTIPPKSAEWKFYGSCQVGFQWLGDTTSFTHNYLVNGYRTLKIQCGEYVASAVAVLRPDQDESVQRPAMNVLVYSAIVNPAKRDDMTSLEYDANTVQTDTIAEETSANGVMKRAQTWSNAFTVEHYTDSRHEVKVLEGLPNGSTWTLTKSHAQTSSVDSTASLDAGLFDIFTASVGIEFGFSDTVTHSVEQQIPVVCPNGNTGHLWWLPEFTLYRGSFSDRPGAVDILVPLTDGDGGARGNFETRCGV
ncbi:hypothetical protein MBLNU230_g0413t1 [Neophaeotheca triangularis]